MQQKQQPRKPEENVGLATPNAASRVIKKRAPFSRENGAF
jgi:hypothetical protein